FDDELWTVEVGGERLEHHEKVVVRRARLVARIEAWPSPIAPMLAGGCLRELHRLAVRELELSGDPDGAGLAARGGDLDAARIAGELASRDRPTRTTDAARLLALFAYTAEISANPSLGIVGGARYVAYITAHAADHATPEDRLPPGSTGFSEERRRQADEL